MRGLGRLQACARPLRRLRACARGVAVVEAAVTLPLVLLMALACLDGARWLQLAARAERAAFMLADATSRADEIGDRAVLDDLTLSTDLAAFFDLARRLAEPLDLDALGGVTVSSVTGTGTAGGVVNWMRASGPAATVSADRLSSLPPLPAGRHFIVAEVFFRFEPALVGRAALAEITGVDPVVYRRALYRTRSAPLTALTTR